MAIRILPNSLISSETCRELQWNLVEQISSIFPSPKPAAQSETAGAIQKDALIALLSSVRVEGAAMPLIAQPSFLLHHGAAMIIQFSRDSV
jgi:hypothetical protein